MSEGSQQFYSSLLFSLFSLIAPSFLSTRLDVALVIVLTVAFTFPRCLFSFLCFFSFFVCVLVCDFCLVRFVLHFRADSPKEDPQLSAHGLLSPRERYILMTWASARFLRATHVRTWIFFSATVLAVTVGLECENLVDPLNPKCLKAVPSAGESPLDLAAELRQCLQSHNHTMVGSDFGNNDFGKVIEAKSGDVVMGPIVPKIGSLWFRKNLQRVGTYRSLPQGGQAFQARYVPDDETPFWVTVIRNPADRMISGYLTVAGALYGAMEREHPECKQTRSRDFEDMMFGETPAKFCRLPKQCREWHFEEFFSESATPVVEIHRVSQLNWIAKAAPHIDALYVLLRSRCSIGCVCDRVSAAQ